MSFSVDQELCTGCGGCIELCPAGDIESDGAVATIDDYLCILCGACQVNCPQNAVLFAGKSHQPDDSPPDMNPAEMPLDCRC
jgi:ferredoxin